MMYKELATLFGVELYEEFMLKETITGIKGIDYYRFTEDGLEVLEDKWTSGITGKLLLDMLDGNISVIKLPFIPRKEDTYYYVYFQGNKSCVNEATWCDDLYDNFNFTFGNCFKKEEEAEKQKETIAKKIKESYEKYNH